MPYIDPLPDSDHSFGVAQLTEASEQWRTNRAATTDRQLQLMATYSPDIAAHGHALREAAIRVKALQQPALSAAAPRRVRDSGIVTIAQFNAFITETLVPILKELLAQRDVRIRRAADSRARSRGETLRPRTAAFRRCRGVGRNEELQNACRA